MDIREQYEAAKAARASRRREKLPKPWWWLGQRDPIARFTKWLAIYTLFLVIFTGISAVILFKTDQTLKQTVVATQRPWISAQVQANTPFTFSANGGANLALKINLKNFGNSVAGAIEVDTKMFGRVLGNTIFDQPRKRQQALCDKARAENSADRYKSRLTLFPGEEYSVGVGVSISNDEIARVAFAAPNLNPPGGTTLPPNKLDKKYITPMLIGCVTYRSAFSETAHQTGFIYDITRPAPSELNRPAIYVHDAAIEVGTAVPIDQLRVERWFFSGNYAD